MTFILFRVCLLELNASFYRQAIISNSSKHKKNMFLRHVSALKSIILTSEETNLDRSASCHCHYISVHTRGSIIFKASTSLPRHNSKSQFVTSRLLVLTLRTTSLAMNLPSTLTLAENEHQSLWLAGGVLVASELLPRFVQCAFHFE